MKRAQASLPEDDSSHANKRLKMDPAAQDSSAQNEEGWTKVEKRKSKKQRKTESKQGVRVPSRSPTAPSGVHLILCRRLLPSLCTRRARSSSGATLWASMCVRQPFHTVPFLTLVHVQDIRELVLHLAADAPPSSWVRVEVCLAFWFPVQAVYCAGLCWSDLAVGVAEWLPPRPVDIRAFSTLSPEFTKGVYTRARTDDVDVRTPADASGSILLRLGRTSRSPKVSSCATRWGGAPRVLVLFREVFT